MNVHLLRFHLRVILYQTQNLVCKGFLARFAEMQVNIKGGIPDTLAPNAGRWRNRFLCL